MNNQIVVVLSNAGTPGSPGGMKVRTVTAPDTSNIVNMLNTDNMVEIDFTSPLAVNVNLPPTPVQNQVYGLKDGSGTSQTFPITINGTIDGIVNPVIQSNGSPSRQFYYRVVNNVGAWRFL